MEKTNNTINTQNNAKETTNDFGSYVIAGYQNLLNDTADMVKAKEELTKKNEILEKLIRRANDKLNRVATNFLQDSVQNVIYKTHEEQDFRESIETDYAKVSDLWQTLDDNQKEMLSDILHGVGLSTGMLLTEVFKAGIKAYVTQGETLESLNDLNGVDMSEVFYVALPTDRY